MQNFGMRLSGRFNVYLAGISSKKPGCLVRWDSFTLYHKLLVTRLIFNHQVYSLQSIPMLNMKRIDTVDVQFKDLQGYEPFDCSEVPRTIKDQKSKTACWRLSNETFRNMSSQSWQVKGCLRM